MAKQNEMIAKLEKFHAYIENEAWQSARGREISFQGYKSSEKKLKILAVFLDNKLKSDTHISNICRKVCDTTKFSKDIKIIYCI